jgi:hypothetical protein
MVRISHCKALIFLALITSFPTKCTQFINMDRMHTELRDLRDEQHRRGPPGIFCTWIPKMKDARGLERPVQTLFDGDKFRVLSLRGGGVSILGNDIASIRKLERKLGGREKFSHSGKKDGWDSMMSGLDKVLAMQDSQEEDPKRKKPTKNEINNSHGVHGKLDVPVKAGREHENEKGKAQFHFSNFPI